MPLPDDFVPGQVITAADINSIKAEVDAASATYVEVGTLGQSGAVGDGTTDDTAAVQAALDRGSALVRRGDVLINEGVFLVGALTIPAGRRLVGAGGTLKAKPNLANNAQIVTLTGEGAAAVGVRLDGNGANQANGVLGICVADADNVSIVDCEIWATSKDAIRAGGTCNDLKVTGNRVRDLTQTAAGISVLSTGARYDVSDNIIDSSSGAGLMVHGAGGVDIEGCTVRGNVINAPGQIPLELFDIIGAAVFGNVITAGSRGITCANLVSATISNNVLRNQTLYAFELNNATDVVVSGNSAYDCACLVAGTSATVGLVNVAIVGNLLVGTGLASPIAGNAILKITKADGLVIADNFLRGLERVDTVIRLGVGANASNVMVRGNTCLVDTANAAISFLDCTQGSDIAALGNKVTITRALVAGDDYIRVFSASQGSVTGITWRDNEVLFTGSIAAATNVVGMGTAFSGASTMARSAWTNNSVVGGPIGFRADVTSPDFVFENNDGRACTTEVSNIDAAVLFRRTQREFEGSAVPSTGAWRVGDRVWKTNPSALTFPGWVCTASGTPGTWREMANLQ